MNGFNPSISCRSIALIPPDFPPPHVPDLSRENEKKRDENNSCVTGGGGEREYKARVGLSECDENGDRKLRENNVIHKDL